MLTVHKFPFEINRQVTVRMNEGAKLLLIECQNYIPCIWAHVDTDKPLVGFEFVITGTGHEAPPYHHHVASFQQGGYVWHMWNRYDK